MIMKQAEGCHWQHRILFLDVLNLPREIIMVILPLFVYVHYFLVAALIKALSVAVKVFTRFGFVVEMNCAHD
jgi:hypothetical protein